jgi:hypothetical protein
MIAAGVILDLYLAFGEVPALIVEGTGKIVRSVRIVSTIDFTMGFF